MQLCCISLAPCSPYLGSMIRILKCAVIVGMWVACGAKAHEAHVHGMAKLEVVQDDSVLTVHLESPLANFFGFERAPRTSKERDAVQRGMERLRDGDAIFVTSPAAGCRLKSVAFDFGALTPAFTAAAGQHSSLASTAPPGNEHADLDAEYTFNCKTPEALHQMDVKLFEVFPGLGRINVQLVTPKSQAGGNLTRGSSRLSW